MQSMRLGLAVPLAILATACAATSADGSPEWAKIEIRPDPVYQPLLQGPPQTRGMESGRVVIAPGKAGERHSTDEYEEQLLFLQGKARVLLGSEVVNVAAGEILYIPPHTEHEIHNDGPEELRYVYVVAPVR